MSAPASTTSPLASGPLTIADHVACATKVPAALRSRIERAWKPPIASGRFWALATAGTRVYGTGGSDDGIYVADVAAKTVRRVAAVPQGASTGWMVANDQALTWLDYDSERDPTRWSLYAASANGADARKVAGSPAGQADGAGRATQPALHGHQLAWTEFASATGKSALKVATLPTGTPQTVASGDFFPPVVMGDAFVWSERQPSGQWRLRAVDATTLKSAALPADLPVKDGVAHMAATGDRLIWGSSDFKTLNVWHRSKHRVDRYRVPEGDDHVFQFMHPTGNLLTWDASWPYSVMNLDTGAFYDVGKDVSVTAADGQVAVSWMSRIGDAKSGTRGPATVLIVPETELPSPTAAGCA